MAVLYTNNAVSALSASITNSQTSFSVTSGHGTKFPPSGGADYFYVTLASVSGSIEIVKVTGRSTDTFTVVRGQDGTTGLAFSAGDIVELRVTKAVLDDIKTDTKSSLTLGNVTTALGFTPYNATNPNSYITSSGSITGSSGSCTGNAATATTATTANALNTANGYTGTAFTASTASAYIVANRTSSGSGQVGYNWAQGGTNLWWSYVDTSGTTLNWYNSVVSANVMTLTTGGALNTTGAITQNGSQVLTASNFNSYAASLTGAETLTNKRINPRFLTNPAGNPFTPDISQYDQFNWTALSSTLSIAAPSGTPVNGNKIMFRITPSGTPGISWNATYTAIGVTLPTTTVSGKTVYVGCIYNADLTRWDVIAVATQA
jgi:hypothetical protein